MPMDGLLLCFWTNRGDFSLIQLWLVCSKSFQRFVKLLRKRTRSVQRNMFGNWSIVLDHLTFVIIRNTPWIPLCNASQYRTQTITNNPLYIVSQNVSSKKNFIQRQQKGISLIIRMIKLWDGRTKKSALTEACKYTMASKNHSSQFTQTKIPTLSIEREFEMLQSEENRFSYYMFHLNLDSIVSINRNHQPAPATLFFLL